MSTPAGPILRPPTGSPTGTVKYGDLGVLEQPSSPAWDGSVDGITVTRSFEGLDWNTIFAARPDIGSTYSDLPIDLTVKHWHAEPSEGGGGKLTVELTQATNDSAYASILYDVPEYQVDNPALEKDLKLHRMYQVGGTFALTAADRNAIHDWEAETDKTKKGTKYSALSTNAKNLADKLLVGTTHYAHYYPVVTQTRKYKGGAPKAQGLGKIDNPPTAANAPTTTGNGKPLTYIKTSDTIRRQQKIWERTEQWSGFDTVDTDIANNL